MISEWLISLSLTFVQWLAGLFGEWTPPAELTGATSGVNGIIAGFSGLGVWVPWAVLSACVLAALATWALVVGIKLLRAVLAHFPMIGGAGD